MKKFSFLLLLLFLPTLLFGLSGLIVGPSVLDYHEGGTYWVKITEGDSPNLTFQWYKRTWTPGNPGYWGPWYAYGTSRTQGFYCDGYDFEARCDIDDGEVVVSWYKYVSWSGN